jgi:hypothetical protein
MAQLVQWDKLVLLVLEDHKEFLDTLDPPALLVCLAL